MSNETPIPAATVLLLRDKPDFEVLMVERNQAVGFAGGALVFPGGRIDPGDENPKWKKYVRGLASDPETASAQVAAIRETFEEAGVLLARHKGDDDFISGEEAASFQEWRAKVEADDGLFLEMIAQADLELACDALCFFARWVAPKGIHKRFDTWFFAARTPATQIVREDGSEATEAVWINPSKALQCREDGSRKIIFPTACNLQLLEERSSVDATFDFAKTRKIEAITPVIVQRDGGAILQIPDDMGYPKTEESLEGLSRE